MWWELRTFRSDMSQPTREMNAQLTKVLVAQAVAPLVILLVPVTFTAVYPHVYGEVERTTMKHRGSGIWIIIFVSSLLLIEPLMTIVLLQGYKRVALGMFARC